MQKLIARLSLAVNEVKTFRYTLPLEKPAGNYTLLLFGGGEFTFGATKQNRSENLISKCKVILRNPTVILPLPAFDQSDLQVFYKVQDNKRRFEFQAKEGSILRGAIRNDSGSTAEIDIYLEY